MSFLRKRVWITGAGRGIGACTADLFQRYNASVIGLDIDFPNEEYNYQTVTLDITNSDQIAQVCQNLLNDNQGPDILVNAAGILRLGSMSELTLADWQACLSVNATGPFNLLKELLPYFKSRRRGAIVNVASNAAHVPRMGMTAYCASKAALVGLSNCVALEMAEFGVRCNLVSPGSTDTQMLRELWGENGGKGTTIAGSPDQFKLGIPLNKIASTDDVANTILFLASDMAAHVTMQDIVVDGGATLGS
ncbi:2,3-dihydro-2,3-dihydroxybenzoate dehydrogenase [Microbulbifer sp. OS29]|uniref:2,3-dihydro-2,3-dihydroxybenzoate dehydrogenase n=1 Tax=Microbulbifer okhotskensis TaxID=2926617 RepID=A0A9X2ELP4_9GAMM|nr:2,3-dihydro-2,3-dihydroxybenzoate dehydrogenase [Microbulbifer okhotskensis]MCO1334534.1 2,3-dihydro-2,3-dihydroxybenzoate dehydrogenase [Microbulbifer okhotskensis]